MCGEKEFVPTESGTYLGSPPHVRGKAIINIDIEVSVRITPACAGKRAVFTRKICQDKDHPRMCGEKSRSTYEMRVTLGSPPHVRGKVSKGSLLTVKG